MISVKNVCTMALALTFRLSRSDLVMLLKSRVYNLNSSLWNCGRLVMPNCFRFLKSRMPVWYFCLVTPDCFGFCNWKRGCVVMPDYFRCLEPWSKEDDKCGHDLRQLLNSPQSVARCDGTPGKKRSVRVELAMFFCNAKKIWSSRKKSVTKLGR